MMKAIRQWIRRRRHRPLHLDCWGPGECPGEEFTDDLQLCWPCFLWHEASRPSVECPECFGDCVVEDEDLETIECPNCYGDGVLYV